MLRVELLAVRVAGQRIGVVRTRSFEILFTLSERSFQDDFLFFLLHDKSFELSAKSVGCGWTEEVKDCDICAVLFADVGVVEGGRRHCRSRATAA